MIRENYYEKKENVEIFFSKLIGSAATFFSITYAIILTLSISYNIGYFKQINPQIVDLMGLGDYIDYTIHNLWFFLLAALLFFGSSLAFVKEKRNGEFYKLITFGVFALIISSYFLLKGVYYSKFWPTIKKLNESITLYMWLVAFLILILTLLIYRTVTKVIRSGLPTYSLGIAPIGVFFIIVLMPYLGGMIHGYIENHEVQKRDYSSYTVNVVLTNDEILKDIFILRKLDKGILIRQFKEREDTGDSRFIFLNWGVIRHIRYYDIAKE